VTEQSSASTATAADLSTPTGHQAELARLRRLVELSVAYVIVIATGAIVGILVLFDEARTASLRNLALISLLGGVLGSAGRNLLDIIERLEWGWEFTDGTQIDRNQVRADRRREELERRAAEERRSRRSRSAEDKRNEEWEADFERRVTRPSILTPDRYFGVHVIPLYLLYPPIGAVLGRLSLRFLLRDLSPPPRGRSGRPLRRRDRHERTGGQRDDGQQGGGHPGQSRP